MLHGMKLYQQCQLSLVYVFDTQGTSIVYHTSSIALAYDRLLSAVAVGDYSDFFCSQDENVNVVHVV